MCSDEITRECPIQINYALANLRPLLLKISLEADLQYASRRPVLVLVCSLRLERESVKVGSTLDPFVLQFRRRIILIELSMCCAVC